MVLVPVVRTRVQRQLLLLQLQGLTASATVLSAQLLAPQHAQHAQLPVAAAHHDAPCPTCMLQWEW